MKHRLLVLSMNIKNRVVWYPIQIWCSIKVQWQCVPGESSDRWRHQGAVIVHTERADIVTRPEIWEDEERRNWNLSMIACLSHFHQRIYFTTSLMRNTCTSVFVTTSFKIWTFTNIRHWKQFTFKNITLMTHFVSHHHKYHPCAFWQGLQMPSRLIHWAPLVRGR